jgi:hypothetical protein
LSLRTCCASVVVVVCLFLYIFLSSRRAKLSVLGTMSHAGVDDDTLTAIGNCFLQARTMGNIISREYVGCSFAIMWCQLKL